LALVAQAVLVVLAQPTQTAQKETIPYLAPSPQLEADMAHAETLPEVLKMEARAAPAAEVVAQVEALQAQAAPETLQAQPRLKVTMAEVALIRPVLARQAAEAVRLLLAAIAQAPLLETVATEQRPLFLVHP
jgi:hypothetical protein